MCVDNESELLNVRLHATKYMSLNRKFWDVDWSKDVNSMAECQMFSFGSQGPYQIYTKTLLGVLAMPEIKTANNTLKKYHQISQHSNNHI